MRVAGRVGTRELMEPDIKPVTPEFIDFLRVAFAHSGQAPRATTLKDRFKRWNKLRAVLQAVKSWKWHEGAGSRGGFRIPWDPRALEPYPTCKLHLLPFCT